MSYHNITLESVLYCHYWHISDAYEPHDHIIVVPIMMIKHILSCNIAYLSMCYEMVPVQRKCLKSGLQRRKKTKKQRLPIELSSKSKTLSLALLEPCSTPLTRSSSLIKTSHHLNRLWADSLTLSFTYYISQINNKISLWKPNHHLYLSTTRPKTHSYINIIQIKHDCLHSAIITALQRS